ncbi:MAG: hypothetical protein AAGI38_03350 [Bacteroidota bacterium]
MKKLLVLSCLFGGIFTSLMAQNGWVRDKGGFYAQLSYNYFNSDRFFNISGEEQFGANSFIQHSVGFYGEYGVTDRFDIIADVPLFRANRFETTETATGIGDLQLQLKYGILTGSVPVAIIVAPEFPTAQANNLVENREIPGDVANLPTGDGEFNLWTTAVASHGLESIPLYGVLHAGYNFRTQYDGLEFRDQYRIGIEVGYTIKEKLILIGRLMALQTIGDDQTTNSFIRTDGTGFTSYSYGLFYKATDNLRLIAFAQNYLGGPIERRNVYQAPFLTFGVAWEKR